MPHRRNELKQLPDEEAARSALKGAAPGEYLLPWGKGGEAMKDPEYVRKCEEGPTGIVRLWRPQRPAMGKPMILSFVYYLAIGIVVAYLASRTLPGGEEYLRVFRVTGTVAWAAYFFAAVPDSVWFGKPWTSTWKLCFEALAYGLLTAGTFGWLWPG